MMWFQLFIAFIFGVSVGAIAAVMLLIDTISKLESINTRGPLS